MKRARHQPRQLDQYAAAKGWLHRFPMWDWVGGRTSELSAVGLLPAALQGFELFRVRHTHDGWSAFPDGVDENTEYPGGTWREFPRTGQPGEALFLAYEVTRTD